MHLHDLDEGLKQFRAAGVLNIDPSFAQAVGMTVDDIAKLNVRQLIELAFDRGFDIEVKTHRALKGEGKLTLRRIDE